MIKDNVGRPIYFSRTSGGYGSHELGLGPYLVTQGLARKLVADVPRAGSRDTMLVPGEGFVDVPRTTVLWDSVFQAPRSIVQKNDWVDRASVGIPALYVSTGFMLAEAQRSLGNDAVAQRVLATTEGVGSSASGAAVIRGVAGVQNSATLEIQGRVVRLYGVEGTRGRPARELRRYLGRREVVCEPVSGGNEHRCRVDDQDLSRVVLYNGGGRATASATPELRALDQQARSARVGIWSRGDVDDD